MKKGKTPGHDGLGCEVWSYGGGRVREKLWKTLNEISNGAKVPRDWKAGVITPVNKKGEKNRAENYGPISLMDAGYKTLASILRDRVDEFMEKENKYGLTQMGFRKG